MNNESNNIGGKAINKAIEKSVDGVGAFFSAICMPAAEEFGLLLKDKVTEFRLRNLQRIVQKAQKVIEHQKISPTGDSSPKVLKEIIEESSWSDDDEIQRMWAGLIAVSASNTKDSDDSLVYIENLRKLTPFQARIINLVYGDPRCCSVRNSGERPSRKNFNPENILTYSVPDILNQYPGDLTGIVPIAHMTREKILEDPKNHAIAISRFKPQLDMLVNLDLFASVTYFPNEKGKESVDFIPTYPGLDFYMRCLGYSVYPIEAFLLTLQHWCELKKIDPFTYEHSAT